MIVAFWVCVCVCARARALENKCCAKRSVLGDVCDVQMRGFCVYLTGWVCDWVWEYFGFGWVLACWGTSAL